MSELKAGRPKIVQQTFTGIVERVVKCWDEYALYTYNYDCNPVRIISIEFFKNDPHKKDNTNLIK